MQFDLSLTRCPKCDYGITEQNSNETCTKDIAHNRQSLTQATEQFYSVLQSAKRDNYRYLRLIVGGGRIKEEVGHLLETEQWRGTIKNFKLETPNNGAYLVTLKTS